MKLTYALTALLTLRAFASTAADAPPSAPNNLTISATSQSSITPTNAVLEPRDPATDFTNSVGMELLKMPGGFWAGKFEVTQKEYQTIMGANPSDFPGAKQPVEMVSWNDAMEFCRQLTAADLKKKSLPKGYHYSLPSEDEWLSLVGDASLTNAITSLNGNSRSGPANVGTTPANNLGLCDVRGNVMEFCLGDDTKPYRFLKGGSWKDSVAVNLRPEFHWWCKPDERMNTFGIRCVLKPTP